MANDVPPRPMADDELYIERVFTAPAQLLFDMWAKAEHMVRWLGPAQSRCEAADLDFRVGGAWRAQLVMDEHGDVHMGGRYLQIDPGRRIVKTFNWRNGEGDPETVITLTFRDLGDGRALQTFHQTPFTNVPRRDSHIEGWNEAFDNQQRYLDTLAKEPAR